MVYLKDKTHNKLVRLKNALKKSQPHLNATNDVIVDRALNSLAEKEGVHLG